MRAAFSLFIATSVLSLGCVDSTPIDVMPAARMPEGPLYQPATAVMPRLTGQQYRNSLKDVFGDALPPAALEPDTNPHLFFSIGVSRRPVHPHIADSSPHRRNDISGLEII